MDQSPAAALETPRYLGKLLARWWCFVGLAVVIMQVSRLWLWIGHTDPARRLGWHGLAPSLALGFFNDAAVASTLALVGLALGSGGLLASASGKRHWLRGTTIACVTLWLLLGFLGVAEFYFYSFYRDRFNLLMFGLVEYDPRVVLESSWDNFPMIRVILGLGVGGWVVSRAFTRGLQRLDSRLDQGGRGPLLLAVGFSFLLLPTWTWLAFSPSHPMEHQFHVRTHDVLGQTLPQNAPLSLVRAWDLYRKRQVFTDANEGLRTLGFATPQEAAKALDFSRSDDQAIAEEMFAQVPGAAPAHHPNVVLMLMESFGADILRTDDPQRNDLLGRLRPHLTQDVFFTQFFAGQNATHPEIENLMFGSPITPLTIDPQREVTYANAGVAPFKKAGYRTIFIYGGHGAEENLARVMRRQGFDEVYDQDDVIRQYPKAGVTPWGVYDAYLFDFAQALLNRADPKGQPLFVFMVTTTNHPPYVLRTPHRTLPLEPERLGPVSSSHHLEFRRRLMTTYQYQADQLGRFLDALDADPVGANTVVAGAGDHNLHEHVDYQLPADTPDMDRVVAFLRVPAAWRPAGSVDRARLAGHKDLFPTLAHLALPGEKYFDTGINLWGPASPADVGSSQFSRVYLPQGMTALAPGPQSLFPWGAAHRHLLTTGPQPLDATSAQQLHRALARVALQDWFIRTQVIRQTGAH